MAPLTQVVSSNLNLPPNSYIYTLISTSPRQDPLIYTQTDTLATISSDDTLRFLNPSTLSVLPDGVIKNANESITCLERVDDPASNIVATAGRDGMIRFWDKRSRQKAMVVQSRMLCSKQPFMSEKKANMEDSEQTYFESGVQ